MTTCISCIYDCISGKAKIQGAVKFLGIMILFKLGVQIPSIKSSSINPRGNAALLNEEEEGGGKQIQRWGEHPLVSLK